MSQHALLSLTKCNVLVPTRYATSTIPQDNVLHISGTEIQYEKCHGAPCLRLPEAATTALQAGSDQPVHVAVHDKRGEDYKETFVEDFSHH